ncbi:hypothetical protein [Endozoicomonas sp. Mp262]|uniref:hypothetical protein n=1 Tax=Endozoicomonas sp. Mp262 TaxID=2919499 RepID=UPI0021D7F6A1
MQLKIFAREGPGQALLFYLDRISEKKALKIPPTEATKLIPAPEVSEFHKEDCSAM